MVDFSFFFFSRLYNLHCLDLLYISFGKSHIASWLLLYYILFLQGVRADTIHVFAHLSSFLPFSRKVCCLVSFSNFGLLDYCREKGWQRLLWCVLDVDCYDYGAICSSFLLPFCEHCISRFRMGVEGPISYIDISSLTIHFLICVFTLYHSAFKLPQLLKTYPFFLDT